MNRVKVWFMARLFREKLLVLAFALLGALIWLSSAGERLKAGLRSYRAAGDELAIQEIWLGNREKIEAAAAAAVKNLEPGKTYDATFLVAEILGIAGRAGLAVNTEPPRTQRSAQFAMHTVQVTSQRADMGALLRFYDELGTKAPYLGLVSISMQGDRSNPGQINTVFQVVSVELIAEGAPKS